jgi:hypothetical protein
MVDGKLVALDTPGALKRAHVPGTMHEVTGDLAAAALGRALEDVAEVMSVRAFGAAAHVRVVGALGDPSAFAALLAARGFAAVSVGPAEATLEDVFLELAAQGGKGSAASGEAA